MNRISWTKGCENSPLTQGAQRKLPTLLVQLGQALNHSFPKQSFLDTVIEQDNVQIDASLTF